MTGQNTDLKAERRNRLRARSLKHVKIMFDGDKAIFDAVLKNVSAYGATIAVDLTERLPDRFNMYFVQDDFSVPCWVKWRGKDNIGVAF